MQGKLFPTIPLHDAVRPSAHRADLGQGGEALFQFADVLEQYFPHERVNRNDPFGTWDRLRQVISNHASREEIVRGQVLALWLLGKYARAKRV